MELSSITVDKPEGVGVILGQTHFIKSVEDIHEAMVNSVPGIVFGLAFNEASGDRLVRMSGTDAKLKALAASNAMDIGAGHLFILLLGEGFFPINVLNAIKAVPEVARVFCATNNPLEVVVVETEQGRGVIGVVDGFGPVGIEDEAGERWRHDLLRGIGYKF
jgi:adenosine/AMP kinase